MSALVAGLPWYDLPSVRWANDVIWEESGLPGKLDRAMAAEDQWRAPALLASQACGLDLFLSGAPIEPVLAPVFDLDCPQGRYFSYLVGEDDGEVAAVNSLSSRSGFSALLTMAKPKRILVTGSHQGSLRALREGSAQIAAIDAVTWQILSRDEPDSIDDVLILRRSEAAMAPPVVVRKGTDAGPVVDGLVRAVREAHAARQALLLKAFTPVERSDYLPLWDEYQRVLQRRWLDTCTIEMHE